MTSIISNLEVLKIETSLGRERDYGLVKAILRSSTKRNATKNPTLNRHMFEPGNVMCQGWLCLHCGVPIGHVFEGKLEVLLAEALGLTISPMLRVQADELIH
jgi:hypothetical protein